MNKIKQNGMAIMQRGYRNRRRKKVKKGGREGRREEKLNTQLNKSMYPWK